MAKLTQITWNIESVISCYFAQNIDDTDEDEDDLDYNGSSSNGSDSIVIKIGSKDASTRKLGDNLDANKPSVAAAQTTQRPIAIESTTTAPNIGHANASSSTATSNYNYNNENYYSKDDMSVYDDVNNNRLNLRSSSSSSNNNNINGRSSAYEERNIYVANNVLSDSNASDSVKSYIHIEVYKGNLDGAVVTAKPKDVKSINAFDVKAMEKSLQLHSNNGTDGTAEKPTTKP